MALEMLQFAFSAFSTLKQYSAEKKAAAEKEEIGRLEAIQYANELFLSRSEAMRASERREEEQIINQADNEAFLLGKQLRSDRSVNRILESNRRKAGKDSEEIYRANEVVAAKLASQAAISRKFGQNSAAGMRAQASANFISNLSNLADNLPKSIADKLSGVKPTSTESDE
jgi:hypothetical protein